MLTFKNLAHVATIIFHISVISLTLGLNQNICSANTPQTNNLLENSTLKSAVINNQTLKTTLSTQQKKYIADIYLQVNNNEKHVDKTIQKLNIKFIPIYEEVQNLHLLHALYADNARILTIVKSHLIYSNMALKKNLKPVILAKKTTAPLLNKIEHIENIIAKYKPDNQKSDTDITNALKNIKNIKLSLNYSLSQLAKSVNLGVTLQSEITSTLKQIDTQLPKLWYSYYLAPPINYLNMNAWIDLPSIVNKAMQQFSLRIPLESPQSLKTLIEYSKYFLVMLFLGGIIGLAYNNYIRTHYKNSHLDNIFKTGTPLLYVGVALGITAIIIENNYYDNLLFLMGNLIIITGQVLLAWNLRYLDGHKLLLSPLLSILPLTIIGYIIIYPGIPPILLTLIWIICIFTTLIYRHLKPKDSDTALLETYILNAESSILWISLILAILGLIQIAIIAYLFVTGLCVAIQLNVGCIQRIHSISNNLPREASRAVMSSLIIALAAPLAIALVFACFGLWIITLPGGLVLINHYIYLSFNIGDTQFNVIKILLFISTFYLARAMISIGTTILQKITTEKFAIDDSIIPPLQTALTYTVWGGYIFLVLYSLGMSWKSLAVVAGGLSVGVGFGLQNIVNNFLSGLILIFSRSLQEKDVVEIGGYIGTVKKINVRATTLETTDNAIIYVPNSLFISTSLINWTRNSRSRRCNITIGVAYDSNVETITYLLIKAAKSFDTILKYPVPSVQFTDFANSTLNFTLYFWVTDYILHKKTTSQLRIEINRLFNANDINIAYPQLDIHIKSENESPPNIEKQALLEQQNNSAPNKESQDSSSKNATEENNSNINKEPQDSSSKNAQLKQKLQSKL